MSPEQKTESFLLRMGPTELRMLQELSDHTGLTKADVVRQLIRKEHAEVALTWLPKVPAPVRPALVKRSKARPKK